MKKVFYSEVLDRNFDSEEECVKAELKEKEKKYALSKNKANEEIQQSRKQAAKVVEEAEKAVSAAYKNLKEVEEKAREAYEKSISSAKKALEEAEEKRYHAIEEFNKKFGVYTRRYTGEEAYKEFLRTLDRLDDVWNIFNF